MPRTTHRQRSISGSRVNKMTQFLRSLSAPAIKDRGEFNGAVEECQEARLRLSSTGTGASVPCRLLHHNESIASIKSSESRRACDADKEELLADDSVFQSGIEDSGVFEGSVRDWSFETEVESQRVEESRQRYTSDDIDEVLQHKVETAKLAADSGLGGLHKANSLSFVAVEGTNTLPKVEVELATPMEEYKPFADQEPCEDIELGATGIQSVSVDMGESWKGFDTSPGSSSYSHTEDERKQSVTKGILKVPLDIRENYGRNYNSHILLVDDVSFQTQMAKPERSHLLKSEKKAFKKLKKIDCMSQPGPRGVEADDAFSLDMLPTLPTPVSPPGTLTGDSQAGGQPTRFTFPPLNNYQSGQTQFQSALNREPYLSLPSYIEEKTDTPPDKPDDHLLFSILVTLCCNPVLGAIAFGLSIATNVVYDKGDMVRSRRYSWWAKAVAILGIVVSLLLCIILLVIFWPGGHSA